MVLVGVPVEAGARGHGEVATKTAAPVSSPSRRACPARDTTWQLTRYLPAARRPSVGRMNENHAKLMPSPEWAAHIQDEVLPQATAGVELGADLLELGPGPGAATDWLRHRVGRLVAVEQEEEAAARLAAVRGNQRRGGVRRRGRARLPGRVLRHRRHLHDAAPRAHPRAAGQGAGRGVPGAAPGRHLPRLGQPAQRRPAPVPRGRHLQSGRAGRVPHPAADRRLRRDHPAGRAQPDLHRPQGGHRDARRCGVTDAGRHGLQAAGSFPEDEPAGSLAWSGTPSEGVPCSTPPASPSPTCRTR